MLAWVLNLGFAADNAGPGPLVRAMQEGVYQGIYRRIGDVFQLQSSRDLSDYDSDILPGTIDSPTRGWMRVLIPENNLLQGEQFLTSVVRDHPRRTVL